MSSEDLCLERGVTGLFEEALAACGRNVSGHRAEQKPDHEPLEDFPLLEAIVRPADVRERPLRRGDARCRPATEIVRLAHEPPATGEA